MVTLVGFWRSSLELMTQRLDRSRIIEGALQVLS